MAVAIATGVFLVFVGRLAYHRLLAWRREHGRVRANASDDLGTFLITVGVAIGIWFVLDAMLRWQTPLPWRLAAVVTGFLLADGLTGAQER